jgi:RNA polymerase sigma-B factor
MEAAGAPQGGRPARSSARHGGSHSGRLLLRMPESLHAELARAAARSGKSLNAHINDLLTQNSDARAAPARSTPPSARRRGVERLLILNAVVLLAVGAVALALLIQALR